MSDQPKSRSLSLDQILKGAEPVGDKIVFGTPDYRIRLIESLNWFSYVKDSGDARKYIATFLKNTNRKDIAEKILRCKTFLIPQTFGWVARLITTGAIMSKEHVEQLEESIHKQLTYREVVTPLDEDKDAPVAAAKPVESDPAVQEKISEYIGELEHKIDHYIATRESFNLFNDLSHRSVNAYYIPRIQVWAMKTIQTYMDVLSTTDKMILDGYRNLPKARIKGIIKLVETFQQDCARYYEVKTAKKTRKPRKKKEKTPDQLVKDMFYLEEFPELGLKSINPSEILDSKQVWVYNTRYKKLGVYYSIDNDGLTVKGSTILGFDTIKSTQKILRQPEKQLNEVLRASENGLNSYLGFIKTSKQPMTGRINKDTIILRRI